MLKARALMRALAMHADPNGEFHVHEGDAQLAAASSDD
jgi:hypothetical protein